MGYIASCACESNERNYRGTINTTKGVKFIVARSFDNKKVYPDSRLGKNYFHNTCSNYNAWCVLILLIFIAHFPSDHSDLPFNHNFIETLAITINFIKTISWNFIKNLNIIKTNFFGFIFFLGYIASCDFEDKYRDYSGTIKTRTVIKKLTIIKINLFRVQCLPGVYFIINL